MNDSLMYADARSASQGAAIKHVDIIILAVSESIFVLVIALAIVPAVFRVAAARQAVFDTFIAVPLPIIKALRSSVQRRIDAIAKAEAEADVGIDIAGGGDEFGNEEEDGGELKALLKMTARGELATPQARGSRADKQEEEDIDLSAAVNASANTAPESAARSKKLRGSRRSYKRAGSARLSTVLAFTWPVLAYMAYFTGLWYWKGTVVDHAG